MSGNAHRWSHIPRGSLQDNILSRSGRTSVGSPIRAVYLHRSPPDRCCRVSTHIFSKQCLVEIVMTGRNRCMYRVQTRSANQFHSLVECQSVFHIVAQSLQIAEGCMSFVAMIYFLGDTEFLQCQYTADTEQYLLFQTVFPVTAIQ